MDNREIYFLIKSIGKRIRRKYIYIYNIVLDYFYIFIYHYYSFLEFINFLCVLFFK